MRARPAMPRRSRSPLVGSGTAAAVHAVAAAEVSPKRFRAIASIDTSIELSRVTVPMLPMYFRD